MLAMFYCGDNFSLSSLRKGEVLSDLNLDVDELIDWSLFQSLRKGEVLSDQFHL